MWRKVREILAQIGSIARRPQSVTRYSALVEFEDALTHTPSVTNAAARALWLAELSDALDRAHRLTNSLGEIEARADDLAILRLRIETARIEVLALQLRSERRLGARNEPKRI